ncbi:S-DNA-T family DNA segregation ATPase FtsK/SpoIIIE OS=Streptomyces albaduncus OX=68172 GN=FHS32_000247 PE=4 SV=1 [Streptomyces griseoloalbus]
MREQVDLGTRVELRLNDSADSSVDRKLSQTLSPDVPGRVYDGKLFAQAALPRLDGSPATGDLGPALDEACRAVRANWHGEPAARCVLPARLPGPACPSAMDG